MGGNAHAETPAGITFTGTKTARPVNALEPGKVGEEEPKAKKAMAAPPRAL